MSKLRIAVIGAGHLGKIHARLSKQHPNCELVAIVDPVAEAGRAAGAEFGVDHFVDIHQVIDSVDAAVVAAPTCFHADIAEKLLACGIHLLVEKPLTNSYSDARRLVQQARQHQCVLQVGHVERFNPAVRAAEPHVGSCKYIEATRTSTFTMRSTDIGVVHDLMIHDLDLVLAWNRCEVVDVQAMGLTLFGPHEDMVQARLTMANGCVANLTASRSSYVAQRQMQVFSDEGYLAIDMAKGEVTQIRPHPRILAREVQLDQMTDQQRHQMREELFTTWLPKHEIEVTPANAILDEQREFVSAIEKGFDVQVSGDEACRALEVADRILAAVERHAWNGKQDGPFGPKLHVPMRDAA